MQDLQFNSFFSDYNNGKYDKNNGDNKTELNGLIIIISKTRLVKMIELWRLKKELILSIS